MSKNNNNSRYTFGIAHAQTCPSIPPHLKNQRWRRVSGKFPENFHLI